MSDDWGHVTAPDGSHIPLSPPEFNIPENERKYIDTGNPRLVLWTRKTK